MKSSRRNLGGCVLPRDVPPIPRMPRYASGKGVRGVGRNRLGFQAKRNFLHSAWALRASAAYKCIEYLLYLFITACDFLYGRIARGRSQNLPTTIRSIHCRFFSGSASDRNSFVSGFCALTAKETTLIVRFVFSHLRTFWQRRRGAPFANGNSGKAPANYGRHYRTEQGFSPRMTCCGKAFLASLAMTE